MCEKNIDKVKAVQILKVLETVYRDNRGNLYKTPLKVLVAKMLSAQSTDNQVNKIIDELFMKYRTVNDFAGACINELQEDIRSIGLHRTKANNILKATQIIAARHNSIVPSNMKDLLELPGVARKTANIVLTNAFKIVEGIAVDTHVSRLSRRIFKIRDSNPVRIENSLKVLLPRRKWGKVNFLFVTHGRKICRSKNPICEKCIINELCPSAFTV